MTMPAFRPNRRAPDTPASVQNMQGGGCVPGILGLKASDADAIGILPVPPMGRFGTGGSLQGTRVVAPSARSRLLQLLVVDGAAFALLGLLVGLPLRLGAAEAQAVGLGLAFPFGVRLVLADFLEVDDVS